MKKTVMNLTIGCLAYGAVVSADAESMTAFRDLLEKWVQTRQLISKEEKDWATSEVLLKDQSSLMREEIKSYNEKAEAAKKEISGSDKTLADLEKDLEVLKDSTAQLKDVIRPLERKVLALLASCPVPLQEKLKPIRQNIPSLDTPEAEIKPGLSVRFQNVVAILNQINKYALDVHEGTESRELADGSQASSSVLYFGISQAIYVNVVNGIAGVGRPKLDGTGWEWIPMNERVEDFDLLMKIYRNDAPANFTTIPVEIREVTMRVPDPEPKKEVTPATEEAPADAKKEEEV